MSSEDNLGTRLREARELAGLTQSTVARLIGVRRPSVSEMESGLRKVSTEELFKLAELYAVSPEWLATGEESTDLSGRLKMVARALSDLKSEDLAQIESVIRMLRAGSAVRDQQNKKR